MKKILVAIMVLLGITISGFSQKTSSLDGITVNATSANDNTFYYGEPIAIILEFSNTKNAVNRYYKPSRVNINYRLKNLSTGKISETGPNYWTSGSHSRGEMSVPPSVGEAFQPNEGGFFTVLVTEDFGNELLTQASVNKISELYFKLFALPIGKYELLLDYYLFPSNQKLTNIYPFEIVSVPAEEKAAFKAYVDATIYGCNTHSFAANNYSGSHPNSYESFIKNYPNSVFAGYAFFNEIFQITLYSEDEKAKVKKYKEYALYYGHLKKSALKMRYVQSLPFVYKNTPGKDPKAELDLFLHKIKSEDPDYSKALIRAAEFQHNIKGLKNYASSKP